MGDLRANRIELARRVYSDAIREIDAKNANTRIANRNIRTKKKYHEWHEYGTSLNRANRIFHVNAIFGTFQGDMKLAKNTKALQVLVYRLVKFCSKYVDDGEIIADMVIKRMRP